MNDKDRTLKALEDMKESMAYAVRRRATADVVTLEAQVLALTEQRDELADVVRMLVHGRELMDASMLVDENSPLIDAARTVLAKLWTSTVAQDK